MSPDDGRSDGIFCALSDDTLAFIIECLLARPKVDSGLSYFDEADRGGQAVLSLAASCRRFSTLIRNTFPETQIEALARSCTRVLPQNQCTAFAFTKQVKDEMLSCDALKMLRAAHAAMALHCANDCCHHVHRAFNKDVRKGLVFSRPSSPTKSSCASNDNQLVSIYENCSLQSANGDGSAVFMYIRERLSKVCIHGEERGRRFKDVVVRYHLTFQDSNRKPESTKPIFRRTNTLDVDCASMSAPLTIRTSPCGDFVVFTRALHEVEPGISIPFSAAFVWHKAWNRSVEVKPPHGYDVQCDALSSQDAWFRVDDRGELMLVVAWSTDFYHSTGHLVGSNVTEHGNSQYMFSSYYLDCETLEHPEHGETTFAVTGSLLSCKPFKNGNSVLTLAKRRDVLNGFRCVHMHNLAMSTCYAVTSTYVDAGPKGPVAAAVSPCGDLVVVVCKNQKSVKTVVCWKTSETNFTPVANLELTPWISLYNTEDSNDGGDLIKASIDIEFSPCSRFFAVIDRHPLFGQKPEQHGAVVVDTSMRGLTNKFRPFPLFSMEDQCPRSFQWTKSGIFLMPPGTDDNSAIGPRGGSLCLRCPKSTGFA